MKPSEPFPITLAEEMALDRRRFLCAAGAAAALVLTGEWAAHRAPSPAPPERVVVRNAVPVGEAVALDTPSGVRALAVRLDADTVVAFDRRCPHLGCPVVWSAERRRFECPCHHAVFEARSGRVVAGPPRRGLTPLAVEVA